MAQASRYRTLVENEEYTAQLVAFMEKYSPETVDAGLLGVFWGICTKPEKFQQTTWNKRQAKSRCLGTVPAFRILFEIEDENVVRLCWIEEIGPFEETS
jgi:hypothetical protein